VTALILCVLFLLPTGGIVHAMMRDNATCRAEAEDKRLRGWLAPARHSLLPIDFYDAWPQRQTPSDLPARVGLIVGEDRPGRHRAPEPDDTPTGQFNTLVGATWTQEEQATLSREWWCASCLVDHRDCAGGCACPCTLVAVS